MKKLITLSLMAICFYQNSTAQIKKGSLSFGGTASGGASGIDRGNGIESNSGGFQSQVSLGIAVKENTIIGLNFGYSGSRANNNLGTVQFKSRSDLFRAGFFWRDYTRLKKDFYFFAESQLQYSRGNNRSLDSANKITEKSRIRGFGIGSSVGVTYRLYKKMYVELELPGLLSLDLSQTTPVTPASAEKQNSMTLSSSLSRNPLSSLAIGFRFIF